MMRQKKSAESSSVLIRKKSLDANVDDEVEKNMLCVCMLIICMKGKVSVCVAKKRN